MPSDSLTVRNRPQSPQGTLSSRLKKRVLNPIINAKQRIITAEETIKTQLRFFKSSTDDFPNLAGQLNNKAREYLEAARFYNLKPTDNDLKEENIKQIHTDSETVKTICDKYPLNLCANQEYVYPISFLQNCVITRPFFRESERAHNIKLQDEIRRTIKEARTEEGLLKQGIRDHLEETIQDGTFVTTYVGNPAALEPLMSQYPDKKARDKFLREKLLEPVTDHLFKDIPDSTLVDLWKNAPQASNMGRFRTATNRLLQPLYEEQRDFRLKPELRELIDKYFPFERLKLKPKFLPREHGLKHSLRLYLNNLKNYEPHLYNFCLNTAQNINAQSPLPKDTKAFINIAVHQSETNLPHLLEILQKQDFNKNECPVYLFINGNDRKQIQERLSEINTFMQENQHNEPEQKLNVRVIAAELDHYRHGLKTIPLNLAYMDLALNHDFKKSDADVAAIYLDADILEFPSNDHISKLKNGILAGKIRDSSVYSWDFDKLTKLNVHYPIMHAFTLEYASIKPTLNKYNKIFNKNNYQTFADTGTANSGGHSSYSSILALLTGATKAHINNEDTDWSERASKVLFGSHLNSFYDLRHMYQAMTNNLPGVEMDEGALRRPMELNRPMRDIWTSHDLIQGDDELSPIDFSKPDELNLKRVKEELNILGKEIMKQGIKFGKTAFKEKYPGKLTHGIIADVLADSLRSLSQAIRQSPLVIEDKTKVLELIQRKLEEFFEYGMNE